MESNPPNQRAHQRLYDDYIVPAANTLFGEVTEGMSLYYSGFHCQEGTSDKDYFINAFRVRLPRGDHRILILTRWGRRGCKSLQHKTIVALPSNYQQEVEKAYQNRLKHGYEALYAHDCNIPVHGAQAEVVIGADEEI